MISSIACFNVFGISTTKYASAAQRSTIDTSRTVLIWFLSVALGLETFTPWCIPGFVLLVFGTLMYNEIIVIRMFKLDYFTKTVMAQREGRLGGNKDLEYISMSPHAAYDTKRNVRALKKQRNNKKGDRWQQRNDDDFKRVEENLDFDLNVQIDNDFDKKTD